MGQEIKHHLSSEILMAYSAGTLPEAFNLMVATHLSLCDVCRAEAESYDNLGGAVLEDASLAGAEMSAGSLAATMKLIEGGPIEVAPRKTFASGVLPTPLQEYVGGDLESINWRPIGMGAKQAILPTSGGATARMLFIPAGAAMPDHSHKGVEMTMVLQGAYQDEEDYFARGDVEFADSDLHHTPVADIHEDCICLTVTDAPLKFNGLIPRLAQPFLRI